MALNTAIRHLKNGDWAKAHAVVQNDSSPMGCWAHGIVHMLEGDLGNARYWYRRAGRPFPRERDASAEIDALVAEIKSQAQGQQQAQQQAQGQQQAQVQKQAQAQGQQQAQVQKQPQAQVQKQPRAQVQKQPRAQVQKQAQPRAQSQQQQAQSQPPPAAAESRDPSQ